MHTITSTDKVLVTGGNGFIALYIVKTLLERGNSVRASVRSESKGRLLQQLFHSHGDRLETVVVPDMAAEGAWDEAVKGVQAIEHIATVADFSDPNPDPEAFIQPTIRGVLSVLESALKAKSDIRRIVYTSSVVAVAEFEKAPRAYTEDDWNESALQLVKEQGSAAGVQTIYSASKVYAERAAWDFYHKHKNEVSWDLTVICPPLVIGAPLGEVSSAAELNASLAIFWNSVLSDTPKPREELATPSPFGDVRDLAEAHVLALEKENAGGERLFVVGGVHVWQDLFDIITKVAPGRKLSPGFQDLDRSVKGMSFSTAKSVEILGMKYRPLEDTVKFMLDDFAKRGF
ncbi:D-lactaldehyde dehydrogenase [Coprinopsis sp. MPI-PUGE-AT-0042]|nr:D-lactaldehyde dehydrogenase [Coprinopsis sp. MPI-PUGE-AT-0042]